ncbi:phosphatidylinositol kinase, partial [Streptomyces sp. NPDC006129]
PLSLGATPPCVSESSVDATRARVGALLASGKHPEPSGEWPAIPWPPV